MSDTKESTALAPLTEATSVEPRSLLEVISRAVVDPRCDVIKMSALLDLQERIEAREQKKAFMAAMGRLAPKLPEIDRNGMSHHGPFSRLIDCDRAIRPLLGDEGLSQSFDTDPSSLEKTGKLKIIMYVSHALGHQEVRHIE